jgi:hypothetical protein
MESTNLAIGIEGVTAESKSPGSASAYHRFVSSLDANGIPACPTGMKILYALEGTDPDMYELAKVGSFPTGKLDPRLAANSVYRAFIEHFQSCYDCQEGGVNTQAHTGQNAHRR